MGQADFLDDSVTQCAELIWLTLYGYAQAQIASGQVEQIVHQVVGSPDARVDLGDHGLFPGPQLLALGKHAGPHGDRCQWRAKVMAEYTQHHLAGGLDGLAIRGDGFDQGLVDGFVEADDLRHPLGLVDRRFLSKPQAQHA